MCEKCYFWFHSEVKFLTIFDVFLDLVILAYFYAISIDFCAVNCFICIFWCNFHVYKWENVNIKDLDALRFLMFFLYL